MIYAYVCRCPLGYTKRGSISTIIQHTLKDALNIYLIKTIKKYPIKDKSTQFTPSHEEDLKQRKVKCIFSRIFQLADEYQRQAVVTLTAAAGVVYYHCDVLLNSSVSW